MRARLPLTALLLVGAAFQTSGTMTLFAADPVVSSATFRGFFPAENGLRWTEGRSEIVFPEPGPGVPVRVELNVSGWRPPGLESPNVVVTAGGRSVTRKLGPGAEWISLETETSGYWRSDLVVDIQSDTFEPGAGDVRKLGVRVEEARLVPTSSGLRVPPPGALFTSVVLVMMISFLAQRVGASPRVAEGISMSAALLIALGYVFARPLTALWLSPLTLVVTLIAAVAQLKPSIVRAAVDLVSASTRALAEGLLRLRDVHVVTIILVGSALVTLAYRAQSRIDIDLGSGREVVVTQGFGTFEGKGGVRSRRAPQGSRLDLSDFGGGAPWKIEAVAALDGAPQDVALLRAGDREVRASLHETTWTTAALSAPAPFGWKSGLVLTIPGASDRLRIDRVTIERGPAWPSLRVVVEVIVCALLALVAFGSMGQSVRTGRWVAGLMVLASCMALATDPLAALSFAPRFLAIVSAAVILSAFAKGLAAVTGAGDWFIRNPVPLAASVSGFVAWLCATAFPYYRGGHFVFHSSIAEEIWKGRFLIYYLPFPGSMLSEQAQWGRIVMPHPALYQTLVSPLSALPRSWFYLSEKIILAALFASLVLVASVVAERVAGSRAAAFTAVLFVGLVPGFQLLGLGHLMTILGVWTSSLALSWLIFRVDELSRRRVWWGTVALLTFCFLSYTAALLFTGAALVFLILVSLRTNKARARSMFTMLCSASAFAFVLYYMNWTLPFLAQSVPKIMGGAGLGGAAAEATPILSRLFLEPGKLSYSYGSMLIPLLGAFSLLFLQKSWDRLVLLSWMGILFFVSGVDLFFNFLLKHHYYVMVPVAVGLGTLMARIESRFGRIPAVTLTLLSISLGLVTALDVALGRIP